MPSTLKQSNLNDYLLLRSQIKDKKCIQLINDFQLPETAVANSFGNLNLYEAVDLYNRSHTSVPIIGKVFKDSVLPILINSPYHVFKEVNSQMKDTTFRSILTENLKSARREYVEELKNEIAFYNSQAKEAYDKVLIPSITYEIDSIAEEHAKKLQNKFSGGFLGFRKWALQFGRDEKKFQEMWDKYVASDVYDSIFDKYINDFLAELFQLQSEIFEEFTGDKRPKLVKYDFMSRPIVVEFPEKELSKVKQYVAANENSSIKEVLSFIPVVGDIMDMKESIEYVTNDSEENDDESFDDDEQLRVLCQQLIVMQINEDYYNECRDTVFRIINSSYNRLLNDIENTI